MEQELSCFVFPYFLVPDTLLKVAVLYFDKIYIDKISTEAYDAALNNLVKEGPFAKYVLGEVRAIESALERYDAQMTLWQGAGLFDSGIISPTSYRDRIDSLPDELMKELDDSEHRLVNLLPEEVSVFLLKRGLRIWNMAGTYEELISEADFYAHKYNKLVIHRYDERMPVEIEQEFRNTKIPDEAFNYRSTPSVEARNALRTALLRSVQEYGANNCFMPAYLPLLSSGITPWVSDSTTNRLLTHHLS